MAEPGECPRGMCFDWECSGYAHEDFGRNIEIDEVLAFLEGKVPAGVIDDLRALKHRPQCEEEGYGPHGHRCPHPVAHRYSHDMYDEAAADEAAEREGRSAAERAIGTALRAVREMPNG